MSDPFRDELAAAHAKIAELEKEIALLKGDPFRPPPRPLVDAREVERVQNRQRRMAFLLFTCCAVFALAGVVAFVLIVGRSAPPPAAAAASPAFSGIAIAPSAQAPQTTPSASPKLDHQNPYVINKCNCQPGDPLCSCL